MPTDLAPNRLALTVARLAQEQQPIIDLTASNPTRAGFSYPPDLLTPLGHPRGLVYTPQPLGLPQAREAVAADFARRGVEVAAEHVALTASTSEAYSFLFKLLCAPGDEVLVPRPSYPLFEHLTRLDAVTAVPYDLEYNGKWSIDLNTVQRALGSKTRAVLIVSPNNPTGQFVTQGELDSVADLCRRYDAAIISDEVFADYELTPGASAGRGLVTRTDILGFMLGGLSKTVGLPQAKLAWIAMSGDDGKVQDARARLELACDTYLSVSTPLQAAAPELLERGSIIREQIQRRVSSNYRALQDVAAGVPACEVLRSEGGWYAVVRVPSLMPEDDLVLSLLTKEGVLAHPGYFFDFPSESFLILSLLAPPAVFVDGVSRVLRRFDRRDDRT